MAKKSLSGVVWHIHQLAAVQAGRELSDQTLLQRVVEARDESAFTVLVERHGPMVLGVCRRALGNADDAEDAFQATFLVLVRKAAAIRKTASLGGWLHRVARSVAANLRRERCRREQRERHTSAPVPSDPAADVSLREVQAALDEELDRLPDRYRAPLVLCYLQGLTRDEAAKQLGLTPGTLHGRLERGRKLLCNRLTRRGLTLSTVLVAAAVGEGSPLAELSPTVVLSLVRDAQAFAGGATASISAPVLSLTQEALKTMFLLKCQVGARAVLFLGLLLTGAVTAATVPGTGLDASSPPLPAVQPSGKEANRPEAQADEATREFIAILREWNKIEADFWAAYSKAKTNELRRNLVAEKGTKAVPLAERCLKLAQTYPDHSNAVAALFWATAYAPDSRSGKQALLLLQGGRIARAKLDELSNAIGSVQGQSGHLQELTQAVFQRVKQDLDHRQAAQLLTWVCAQFYGGDTEEVPPNFAEAGRMILERFPDSPDIWNFCECLAPVSGTPPRWAGKYEPGLSIILEKNRHRIVRVTAHFALASIVARSGPERQDEAVRLFEQLLKDFDGSDQRIEAVENELRRLARNQVDEIRNRAVGRPAQEIEGVDLDEKAMKLSEHRGKVVLLSFWAAYCFPCVKLLPHERELVKRLQGKPFVLIGVNADTEAEELAKALKTHQVNWRSFRDRRAGKPAISDEWKILGFPTLYLIDHKGIIRNRWIGSPPPEELNRAVDRLVEAASRKE
jgi:RNA polymerase sigma factor (sigma-70 family)